MGRYHLQGHLQLSDRRKQYNHAEQGERSLQYWHEWHGQWLCANSKRQNALRVLWVCTDRQPGTVQFPPPAHLHEYGMVDGNYDYSRQSPVTMPRVRRAQNGARRQYVSLSGVKLR